MKTGTHPFGTDCIFDINGRCRFNLRYRGRCRRAMNMVAGWRGCLARFRFTRLGYRISYIRRSENRCYLRESSETIGCPVLILPSFLGLVTILILLLFLPHQPPLPPGPFGLPSLSSSASDRSSTTLKGVHGRLFDICEVSEEGKFSMIAPKAKGGLAPVGAASGNIRVGVRRGGDRG